MTAIAGLVDGGNVWIGCDSAAVSGWDLTIRSDNKLFKNGPFLIGFTSSYRMGQLLRYKFEPPERGKGSAHKFMCTVFVDAVRKVFKAGGYGKTENGEDSGGDFLVGYGGALFKVYGDYQVGQATDGIDACGCGEDYVRGSLFTSKTWTPRKRILTALKASERMSAGVRGPFKILCLKGATA